MVQAVAAGAGQGSRKLSGVLRDYLRKQDELAQAREVATRCRSRERQACSTALAECVRAFGQSKPGEVPKECSPSRCNPQCEQEEGALSQRASAGQELERRLQRASAAKAGMQELYEERFSTRSQRLTRVTAEVKSLARKAGLNPGSLSYPEQPIEGYGLVKRSFIFNVQGTYQELRQFLNLMELSNSFLTLESISLSEAGEEQGPELRMNLKISTLFAQETGPEELGAERRLAAEAAERGWPVLSLRDLVS